jgi:hypothetical protein
MQPAHTYRRAAIPILVGLTLLAMVAVRPGPAAAAPSLTSLKMLNYWPAIFDRLHNTFWSASWNTSIVDADFGRIAALHANAVRIFIPSCSDQFGYPVPLSQYTSELSQLVQIASNHGLAVYLNLFTYCLHNDDIAGSEQWAQAIVSPYAGDARIAAVEVVNEINPADSQAVAWAQAIIPYVRSVSGGVPVTISICGCDNAGDLSTLHTALGTAQPDGYSFHYYTSASNAASQAQFVFQQAKNIVAPLTLVIGETGLPTCIQVIGYCVSAANSTGEQQQSQFFTVVENAAKNVGLSGAAPWILYDYKPTPGRSDSKEDYFGLYRMDGSAKAAASVVSSAFGP